MAVSHQTTLRVSPGQDNADGGVFSNGHQPADMMMKTALNGQYTKRERSQNWEQTEKFVLVRLVQQRLAVIEDKAADTEAVQRRKQAWREIHDEFTAKIGSRAGRASRSIQRIREQWRRMKYWARHEMDVYLETQVEVNGKMRYGRKPNELAQYINGMMAAVEQTSHGYRVASYLRMTDNDVQGDIQDNALHPPNQLPLSDLQSDINQEEQSTAYEAKEAEITIDMDATQVKQETVELVDEDESNGVAMVSVSSIPPIDVHSLPCQSISQQPMRVDSNGRPSSSNSTLPSWATDFPEIVGERAAPRPTKDVDNDEDESDFLEDSDDEEMFGSYSDWGKDIPSNETTTSRFAPLVTTTNSKLEKQQQIHARWEFKRRMQMMEEEHVRRMQILEIQRETAQMRKKLVFRQLKKSRAPPSSVSSPYGRRAPLQR